MKFTTESFAEITDSLETATKAADVLNGDYDPEEIEEVDFWVRHCSNRPSTNALKMAALNTLFDMHGVEAIRSEGEWVDSYHGDIIATYLNTGDTYAATVLLESESGEFVVTSFGDWLEAWEQEKAAEVQQTLQDELLQELEG